MATPDEALHDAREASRLFTSAPRGSEAEREAAAALAAAFDALDDHLSAGGGLPGDWERLTAPAAVRKPAYPADTVEIEPGTPYAPPRGRAYVAPVETGEPWRGPARADWNGSRHA